EAANRELEAFSYSVSHDLQAPVRAVAGYSQILLKGTESKLSERDQHLLRHICDSAKEMAALIEGLLNLSRFGRQPLTKRPVNVSALAHEVLEELREEHRDRRVEVRVGQMPDCLADEALLKQVLVNLLSNAFKYTRQKEKAVVE